MPDVVSPGHKLGQMIGNFFENLFAEDLVKFSEKHGYYCDSRGPRPRVRGSSRKVTWADAAGNKHDLDYVIEKGGSATEKGAPIAFIELAWRRYTKHSRNKTGELEGSLLHLRDSYQSCRFIGAILAGEYTDGGKNQLTSHGITVLHVPFGTLADCFRQQGVELNYPEDAPDAFKKAVIHQWEQLTARNLTAIKTALRTAIRHDYSVFKQALEKTLQSRVTLIRILPLYGFEMTFASVPGAVKAIKEFLQSDQSTLTFIKFEVQIRFANGDPIERKFQDKAEALKFLTTFL